MDSTALLLLYAVSVIGAFIGWYACGPIRATSVRCVARASLIAFLCAPGVIVGHGIGVVPTLFALIVQPPSAVWQHVVATGSLRKFRLPYSCYWQPIPCYVVIVPLMHRRTSRSRAVWPATRRWPRSLSYWRLSPGGRSIAGAPERL